MKFYNKDKKFEVRKSGERNGGIMRRYYIDPERGTGDGTSPEKAGKSWEELSPEPGDMVLFKRGSRVYGRLQTKEAQRKGRFCTALMGRERSRYFVAVWN